MFDIFFLLATWNLNDDPCFGWSEKAFFLRGPRPSKIERSSVGLQIFSRPPDAKQPLRK